MSISAHGSLDGLCIIHAKLFEYVMCVLCLTNESPFFGLLDSKSKKECENSHHGHFKSIGNDFAKTITKGFVSRTKDNIIDMYLAYKQIFSHFSCEESRIGFTNPKTIFNKKISKAFIPYSWCLLMPIDLLMDFINMVRMLFTFEVGSCSTYTYSLIGPFKKALLTSI
jgi:hypothetical protein